MNAFFTGFANRKEIFVGNKAKDEFQNGVLQENKVPPNFPKNELIRTQV